VVLANKFTIPGPGGDEKPIGGEELRGVAVYCGVKLAQAPFFFLLSGGHPIFNSVTPSP